jgi:hypothetical protein
MVSRMVMSLGKSAKIYWYPVPDGSRENVFPSLTTLYPSQPY